MKTIMISVTDSEKRFSYDLEIPLGLPVGKLMLCDIQKQAAYEEEQMQKLKAAGKEKSATYRQFFGNRLFYKQMLDTYKKYGLIE